MTRRATMLDAGEADHRRRTRRLRGGAGRPLDRRPRRRGGARGAGAPLRRPARAVAARPRHRLPVRRPAARRGARVRGARSSSATANGGCARRFRRAMSARSRSWCAVSTSTPTRCGARLRLRGSQQASVVIARIGSGAASRATAFICPGRRADTVSAPPVRRQYSGSDAPVPKPVPALEDVRRCAFSGWLLLCWRRVSWPVDRRCGGVAQSACADLAGIGRTTSRICTVHTAERHLHAGHDAFPTDYPDQQALDAYLTQTRDGFVNVARDAGFVQPAVRAGCEGNRIPVGLAERRHPERGVRRCGRTSAVRIRRRGTSRSTGTRQEGADHVRHLVQAWQPAARCDLPGREQYLEKQQGADRPASRPASGSIRPSTRTSR